MRFFSNEGKNDEESSTVDVHTRDEQTRAESTDDPGTVSSEPVAVPQQRAGSPWSEGPTGYAGDQRTPATSGDDASGDGTRRSVSFRASTRRALEWQGRAIARGAASQFVRSDVTFATRAD